MCFAFPSALGRDEWRSYQLERDSTIVQMVQALRDLIAPHSQLTNDPNRKQTALDISDSIHSLLQAGHKSDSLMQTMPMQMDSSINQPRKKSSLKPACSFSKHATMGNLRQSSELEHIPEIKRGGSLPHQEINEEADENDADFLNQGGICQGRDEGIQEQGSVGNAVFGTEEPTSYDQTPARRSFSTSQQASTIQPGVGTKRTSALKKGSLMHRSGLHKNTKLQRTTSSPLQSRISGGITAKQSSLQRASSLPLFQ